MSFSPTVNGEFFRWQTEIDRARGFSSSKEWVSALAHLNVALSLSEEHQRSTVLQMIGDCFRSMGNYRQAANSYTLALAEVPGSWDPTTLFACPQGRASATLHCELASVLRCCGEQHAALEHSATAVSLAIVHSSRELLGSTMYHLAGILLQFQGAEDAAKKWIARAREVTPIPSSAAPYAWIALSGGDPDLVEECVYRALWCAARDGKDQDVYTRMLHDVYQLRGEPDRAELLLPGKEMADVSNVRPEVNEREMGLLAEAEFRCAHIANLCRSPPGAGPKKTIGVVGARNQAKSNLMCRLLGVSDWEKENPFGRLAESGHGVIIAEYVDSPVTTIKIEYYSSTEELVELFTGRVSCDDTEELPDLVESALNRVQRCVSATSVWNCSSEIWWALEHMRHEPAFVKQVTVSSRAFKGLGAGARLIDILPHEECMSAEKKAFGECDFVLFTDSPTDGWSDLIKGKEVASVRGGMSTPCDTVTVPPVFRVECTPGQFDRTPNAVWSVALRIDYFGLRAFLKLPL